MSKFVKFVKILICYFKIFFFGKFVVMLFCILFSYFRSYELTRKDRLFKNLQRMQQIKVCLFLFCLMTLDYILLK